jgi:hypothetical protein
MDKLIWFYQHYCSKHPKLTEILLVIAGACFIHFGLAFVKDAASSKAAQMPIQELHPVASSPAVQTSNSASTTGPDSPATAGDHNNTSIHK